MKEPQPSLIVAGLKRKGKTVPGTDEFGCGKNLLRKTTSLQQAKEWAEDRRTWHEQA